MAFASLDTGIEHILLLIPHQPAEIRAVDAELIETGHDPSQHFVDVVTFGNHCELAVESAQESVRLHLFACQHIAADVTQLFVLRHVSGKHMSQQCADFQFAISRFHHFRSCNGYGTGHVHPSGIEQTSDEDYGFRADSPHRLTFHYGSYVIDLYPYISGRVRSVKYGYCDIFSLCQGCRFLFDADTQIRFGYFSQGIQSCLEISFFPFQNVFEIGCQRVAVESRDEDSPRSDCRIGNHVIRTLFHKCKHTSFQECSFHSLAIEFGYVLLAEFFVILLCGSLHHDVQHLTACTALHACYNAANGRNKFHFRMILVDKQGSPGHHIFLLFHHHLRSHSWEIIGYECVESRFFHR